MIDAAHEHAVAPPGWREHLVRGPVVEGLEQALEEARAEMYLSPDPLGDESLDAAGSTG